MIQLRVILLVSVALILGCGSEKPPEFDPGAVTFVYTERTSTILAGATRVEVFRLDGGDGPLDQKPKVDGAKKISGFLVLSQGQYQGKDFAEKLAAILSDEKTYTAGTPSPCYWPGVAFRFWMGEECLDVLICFKCHNLYCGPPTDKGEVTASFRGSPRRLDLVRLAKEAFPDDPEIQALK